MVKDSNLWTLDAGIRVLSAKWRLLPEWHPTSAPRPRNRWTIWPHTPQAAVWLPHCPGDAASFWPDVHWLGGTAASGCIALTSLTGKMPLAAVKAKTVAQKPSSLVAGRPVGLEEKKFLSGVGVRYLYQPVASSKRFAAGQQNLCVLYGFTG